jgi:hypothetical protein
VHDHHSGRRKGKREYISNKHKSKGGFDNQALKKKYLQMEKIKECAFLTSLSDLNHDSVMLNFPQVMSRLRGVSRTSWLGCVSSSTLQEATTRASMTILLLRYHIPPMISLLR